MDTTDEVEIGRLAMEAADASADLTMALFHGKHWDELIAYADDLDDIAKSVRNIAIAGVQKGFPGAVAQLFKTAGGLPGVFTIEQRAA